jgi:hypothetical protein
VSNGKHDKYYTIENMSSTYLAEYPHEVETWVIIYLNKHTSAVIGILGLLFPYMKKNSLKKENERS